MSLPDARVNKNLEGTGARARIQRFGGHLAGMIMPNIGAFIAWGMQQSGPFGAQALGLSGLFMTGVISNGAWLWYLGGLAIAIVMGFVLTYFFGFKEKMVERLG